MKQIFQAAEAIIYKENNTAIKRRIKKSYRISQLDEKIRKSRTKSEAKLLEKASKIINIPKVIKVDEKNKEIIMEFIDGKKLSDSLNSFPVEKQIEICRMIGESVAKLHDSSIIHGDLTTSNMILVKDLNEDKIYFIDFGLGFTSLKVEDKAVDLHLLKQALEAKHFQQWEKLFQAVLKGYSLSKNEKAVLERFNAVEKRGRYRKKAE
ncbi:MAG: KEOPS complex kinase/ATPase Bud32 [archaeon]|nr:KEOPS complex kinase/ATPase Bud32 [archaeon]